MKRNVVAAFIAAALSYAVSIAAFGASPLRLTTFDLQVARANGSGVEHYAEHEGKPVKLPEIDGWVCTLMPRERRGGSVVAQTVVCQIGTLMPVSMSATAACTTEARDMDVQRFSVGGKGPVAVFALSCATGDVYAP